jgi:Na+/H+ antiporter NhaD/arsenite permease-like protein
MASWIMGAVMGALCLVGLFIASRSNDALFTGIGYLLVAIALALILVLIHRNTGRPRPHGGAGHRP